ncbi:MAG: hypothetical protein HY925_04135 [Elusimicrobia bacterium]|nr:hypothetical protein [Elusimicrobiota bacterium]
MDLIPGAGFALAVALALRLVSYERSFDALPFLGWLGGSAIIYVCMLFSFAAMGKAVGSIDAGFPLAGALGALLVLALFSSLAAPVGFRRLAVAAALGASWAWAAMALNTRGWTTEWPFVLFVGWHVSVAVVLGSFAWD